MLKINIESKPEYIELWQQTGTFTDFKLAAKVPWDDTLVETNTLRGWTDEQLQLENAFKRCNIADEGGDGSWTTNEGIVIVDVSHSASVGDLLVVGKQVWFVAGAGFDKIN